MLKVHPPTLLHSNAQLPYLCSHQVLPSVDAVLKARTLSTFSGLMEALEVLPLMATLYHMNSQVNLTQDRPPMFNH
jgi:hypothetical protein